MTAVMMACGHAANSVTPNGDPVCVICIGISPGADRVADTPDLTGRAAKCSSCSRETPSALTLAFFEHKPDRERDSYYCGCWGWD